MNFSFFFSFFARLAALAEKAISPARAGQLCRGRADIVRADGNADNAGGEGMRDAAVRREEGPGFPASCRRKNAGVPFCEFITVRAPTASAEFCPRPVCAGASDVE